MLLGCDLALDDHLGRDAGMVGSCLPEGVLAAHPVIADEDVHNGLLEGMAHVEDTGYVGRRKGNAECPAVGSAVRLEAAAFFPAAVDFLF